MKKQLATILVVTAFSSVADEIKIYTWEGFIADSVIADFEQQTGHTISQTHFSSELERDQNIVSGRANAFDLVMIDHMSAQALFEQGYVRSAPLLTHPRDEIYQAQFDKSCGVGGYPYAWGTMGLVYRSSVAKTELNSWAQLFSPPTEHQSRTVIYVDEVDTVAAALLAHNLEPFTADKQQLQKAYKTMLQSKSTRLGLGYLASRGIYEKYPKASLALGYAGDNDYLNENTRFDDWQYVVPDEGTLLWVECLTLPIDRGLMPATLELIEFLSTPQVAAKNAEQAWFATPVIGAYELTSNEHQQDKTLYPDRDILDKSRVYQLLDYDALQVRSKMINNFY